MLDSAEFRADSHTCSHSASAMTLGCISIEFHALPRWRATFQIRRSCSTTVEASLVFGRYAGRREEVSTIWSHALRELAHGPNVSGEARWVGMHLSGLGFETRTVAASSLELSEAWRPWMETCIELFGPSRCMFESNFPADKASYAYGVGWNAMKRIAAGASAHEKDDLFCEALTASID